MKAADFRPKSFSIWSGNFGAGIRGVCNAAPIVRLFMRFDGVRALPAFFDFMNNAWRAAEAVDMVVEAEMQAVALGIS